MGTSQDTSTLNYCSQKIHKKLLDLLENTSPVQTSCLFLLGNTAEQQGRGILRFQTRTWFGERELNIS